MEKATQARLNEVLRELYSAHMIEGVKHIETTDAETGEEGETSHRIFHIEDIDVYVKIHFESNSYGEDEIMGITFVTPTEKTITAFIEI